MCRIGELGCCLKFKRKDNFPKKANLFSQFEMVGTLDELWVCGP